MSVAVTTAPRTRLTKPQRRAAFITGALVAIILAAALVPVRSDSREELFDIPRGTWAHRMAGQRLELLPNEIHLVLGVRDVFVLKNSDDVPHMFGPTLLMPEQTLRIPFTTPSENHFACTAHASGSLIVVVEEAPSNPWARLKWRASSLGR